MNQFIVDAGAMSTPEIMQRLVEQSGRYAHSGSFVAGLSTTIQNGKLTAMSEHVAKHDSEANRWDWTSREAHFDGDETTLRVNSGRSKTARAGVKQSGKPAKVTKPVKATKQNAVVVKPAKAVQRNVQTANSENAQVVKALEKVVATYTKAHGKAADAVTKAKASLAKAQVTLKEKKKAVVDASKAGKKTAAVEKAEQTASAKVVDAQSALDTAKANLANAAAALKGVQKELATAKKGGALVVA